MLDHRIHRVAITYRPSKKEAWDMAIDIVKWLSSKNCECYSHPDQKLIPQTKRINKSNISKLDFALVLGGDGTYLHTVRMLHDKLVPILGVHLGSFGFLTQSPQKDVKANLLKALKGTLPISNRVLLEVILKKNNKESLHFFALNDIVFERGDSGRLIYMSITAGDRLITDLKADGLVVSTPTGSTAYNLAAGGPIVYPEVPVTLITPICSHSLTARPLAISNEQTIEIKLTNQTQRAVFLIDGQREKDITFKDTIIIKKAQKKLQMLMPPSNDYFDILRKKLRFGQRD